MAETSPDSGYGSSPCDSAGGCSERENGGGAPDLDSRKEMGGGGMSLKGVAALAGRTAQTLWAPLVGTSPQALCVFPLYLSLIFIDKPIINIDLFCIDE